jgi:hypothetical protein
MSYDDGLKLVGVEIEVAESGFMIRFCKENMEMQHLEKYVAKSVEELVTILRHKLGRSYE